MTKALSSPATPQEETFVDVYADPGVPPRRGNYSPREAEAEPTGPSEILLVQDAIARRYSSG